MRGVSPRFLTALRGSHKMVARCRLVAPGQSGVSPVGPELPIRSGDVKLDGTAAIRGTLTLMTVGEFPETPSGLLTPYGNEIFVERGIDYGDGTKEYVGLGYFRIDDVDQSAARRGLGEIALTGSDRMAGLIDARVLQPFEVGSAITIAEVFDLLVKEVYPSATIEFDFNANVAFGASHVVEESRFEFLDDIVLSRGKIWYWDHRGVLVIKSAPNLSTPLWTVNAGRDGVLVRMSRKLTRNGVYNAVVANGEPAGEVPPVRGVALDTNPYSPTFWDGKFGKVPKFYSSSFIRTQSQADNAARAMLQREQGVPYQVDLAAVPNSALEPFDPIAVIYDDKANTEIHTVESNTIPLTAEAGAMPIATRQKLIGAPIL